MRYIFFGGPDIAARTLRQCVIDLGAPAVIVTTPARPAGRGLQITPSAVAQVAAEICPETRIITPEHITADIVQDLSRYHADISLVVAYPRMLGPKTRNVSRLGTVNLHPSLLPLHRGPDPIRGALLSGDVTTGISVMIIDDKMDAGPILDQCSIPIDAHETFGSLYEKVCTIGPGFFTKTVLEFVNGTVSPIAQDDAKATYTKKTIKSDAVLDPKNMTAVQVCRLVRSYFPTPGAFISYKDGAIKILDVGEPIATNEHTVPGLYVLNNALVHINCADGSIVPVLRVQPANGKPMSAGDWARGLHPYEKV